MSKLQKEKTKGYKSLFRRKKSSSSPLYLLSSKRTRNIAAARRYEVATQFSRTASSKNSFPIEESAIFTEEPIKDVRKEASVATNRATLLFRTIL